MKTPFRRLMLVFAITVLAVLTAFPLFAAPAPDTLAVFELERSSNGAINLAPAAIPDQLLEVAVLLVNMDQDSTPNELLADGYLLVNDKAGIALATMRAEETAQFSLANNGRPTATLRPVLTINTEDGPYILMAIYRSMHTPAPSIDDKMAQLDDDQTGGSIYQVNNEFDQRAATLDQEPSGAWVITR